MMLFGRWGDAPIAAEGTRWPGAVPVGVACLYCDEPIGADDAGVVMPYVGGSLAERYRVPAEGAAFLVVDHRECLAAQTAGHVVGVCCCTGWEAGTRGTAREVQARLDARTW